MDGAEDKMVEQQALRSRAEHLLRNSGCIHKCPHGRFVLNTYTYLNWVYEEAELQVQNGEVDVDPKEYLAMIKDVVDDAAFFGCQTCVKISLANEADEAW